MLSKRKSQTSSTFPTSTIQLDDTFIWQIWLLKTATKGKSNVKLFYSWIVPSDSNYRGWQSTVEETALSMNNTTNKVVRIELMRADFYGTGKSIEKFIGGLLTGMLLSEIETDETSPIPDSFLNMSLGGDLKAIESNFVTRPEVMLPIDHLLAPWTSKATPNPTDYCIFVSQLFFKPKMDLLLFEGFDLNLAQTKEAVSSLTGLLKKATGFDMAKESAPRIGNIEWYRMPVSDGDQRPLISYGAIRDNGTAKAVRVYLKPLAQGFKSVLIRCRIINGEEVSLDQVKESHWSQQELTFDFCSGQPVSEIEVTVWEKDNDGLATILFEQSSHCIRSMRTQMSIVGSQINSGRINLLNKLAGKEEEKKAELAKFSRSTAASTSETGGYDGDPWVSSSRSVLDFMKKLYPEKSKGHFFLNGWDQEKGESGQLSFIEWIFKVISGEQRGGLIFLDPYFDKDAIEIFANARTTNTKYRIVTCTQHREKDEKVTTESTPVSTTAPTAQDAGIILTKAAQGIRDTCEEKKPLISNLELYINDLVSIDHGKQQLFHDRYLLLLDKDGQLDQGFHLSNSLQGATRKAPLLVTPIPEDILPNVYGYIESLINPPTDASKGKKTEIVQIYPIPKLDPAISITSVLETVMEPEGKLKDIPDAGFFFSQLLGNPSLKHATLADLYKSLKSLGIIGEENDSVLIYEVNTTQLELFVRTLNSLNQEEFNRVMAALGESLARGQDYRHEQKSGDGSTLPAYNALEELIRHIRQHPAIADKMLSFLATFTVAPYFAESRMRIYQIFNEPTFEEVLESTITQLNHMSGDFFGIDYKYYYTCKLLVKCFPVKAVLLLEGLLTTAVKGGWNEAVASLRATMLLISTLAHRALRYYNQYDIQLQVVLLKSNDYRIRASACAALVQGLSYGRKENYSFEDFSALLYPHLSDDEYRLAISAFIAELSIPRNRAEQAALKEKAYNNLTTNWIGSEKLIKRIVAILSGRLDFNWSYEISIRFLDPLITTGSITSRFCFNHWNEVFKRKITFHKKYISGSSDNIVDHFSESTDFQLTSTIIHYFSQLRDDEQLEILKQWFDIINPMWTVINKPFAYHSSFNSLDGACQRVYWIATITEILIEHGLGHTQALQNCNDFLEKFQTEIAKAKRYLHGKYISSILGLRDNYETANQN